MAFSAFACSTSVTQGYTLDFRVTNESDAAASAGVRVFDVPTATLMLNGSAPRGVWSLPIPLTWPSSLYKAVFDPGGCEAYFVVRAANPGAAARIVVAIPFATWQAYNLKAIPGQSIYDNEQPDRAARVTFDRPTPGSLGWEDGFLNWLPGSRFAVEYCSGLDLHHGLEFLRAYQLLVCIGHDEYWSREMRDCAEAFAERGGNIAFFTGNTCWWQVRFEDDMRTMVCYRDATQDPLSRVDDSRVTVEWTSAPVNRPENGLTGVSFRRGAGCWANLAIMDTTSYTCRFGSHWVFEGTGLRDGDTFATGAVGYETDAAEFTDVAGIPRITGRDGTPPSFVVLATADLSDWRRWGQGGMATMGVFRKGRGTVFNAATTGWGRKLGDATVARITRNVLDRLSRRYPGAEWEQIGPAQDIITMVVCENRLWACDSHNNLWCREPVGQNLAWTRVGNANNMVAMASPREAMGGQPLGIYGVSAEGGLWYRDAVLTDTRWTRIADASSILALAASHESLFAATAANDLLFMRFANLARNSPSWTRVGRANNIVAMTNLNGRLFAVDTSGTLWIRPPLLEDVPWEQFGHVHVASALAGHAGKLFTATTDNFLWWRDALAD